METPALPLLRRTDRRERITTMSDERPHRLRLAAPLARRPAELRLPCHNPGLEDVSNLAELMLDAYRGTIDASGDETPADALAEVESYFAGESGEPLLACSFVAEEDGFPVSACLISLYQDLPLVAYSFTGAAWKGRGYATALLQLAMNCLAAHGYERLALWVTHGNADAEHIYAKLGFREE
jgi:GNAT superfamily N-acetyltransferase